MNCTNRGKSVGLSVSKIYSLLSNVTSAKFMLKQVSRFQQKTFQLTINSSSAFQFI
jgi:hypothetical protein